MITILRSEYENLKREVPEFRSLVEQLRDKISLLKGERQPYRFHSPFAGFLSQQQDQSSFFK